VALSLDEKKPPFSGVVAPSSGMKKAPAGFPVGLAWLAFA
jgi:hypothetical protein